VRVSVRVGKSMIMNRWNGISYSQSVSVSVGDSMSRSVRVRVRVWERFQTYE
jgi:hypothetical protein